MPNKFDKIAEKKKRAALAKQDEDVERFAGKVAGEVLGGIGDLSLKDSVAEFATSVAQAVVMSNETLDASLKDNFSQLLSAVKDNKPDGASQVDLALKVGESLAALEAAFNNVELSPQINLEAVSADDLKAEVGKILARLPQDSQRIVTVAYENASADKYLNVRLTDGIKFYKAGGASVVAGGGGSTVDTSSLATSAKQDTLIGHVDGVETLLGTIDADTSNIDANAGATGDAAATVGGAGTISAKLRLITSQLNTIDGNTNGIETLLSAIAAYVDDLESLLATSNINTGAIATDAAAIEALLTTIDGRVDGVETLLTAIDGHVDALESSVDGVETLIGTTNSTLTTIDSRVDGLETSTSSIDTKTPALGQALAAASTPVVLTAAQEAALTPPAAITGFATSAKQDTLLAELQLKADLTETQPVSLASVPTHAVTQSGTWTEANSAAIKTAVETLDNAIAGSEMQVDVVGALPAGANAIGKLAANSGVDIGDVDVTSAVSGTLDHGSNLDIDTAAEQITSTSFACKFGVTLKADITNTGIVYVGNSDVTASGTAATDGFPLSAGETLTLEVTNSNLLYAIASANNQKIFWVAV